MIKLCALTLGVTLGVTHLLRVRVSVSSLLDQILSLKQDE